MDAISGADTAWVLLSAALVMLMTPGLGLFYGGLVRQKNVLSTIMHSFFMLALIGVQWVLIGYSLAFGPDKGGVIGGLEWLGLTDVGLEPNPTYAATIPHQAFMAYQMMFAVITPALISGAFAERKRFKAFAIFSVLWATLVYDPVAHWVWADGGWLRSLGALDFAGGTVVHITSGISALVCALVLGRRLGYGSEPMEPHNATMTVLGAGLLWFGWFGFNAGSALSSGPLAVSAFVTTNTAAAMAALTWMTASWMRHRRPSVIGARGRRCRWVGCDHTGSRFRYPSFSAADRLPGRDRLLPGGRIRCTRTCRRRTRRFRRPRGRRRDWSPCHRHLRHNSGQRRRSGRSAGWKRGAASDPGPGRAGRRRLRRCRHLGYSQATRCDGRVAG